MSSRENHCDPELVEGQPEVETVSPLTSFIRYVTKQSHMNDSGLAAVWKALADPTRRRILDLLKSEPRTTGDLCEAFPLSRFAVMKHLGVLEGADLVVVRRRGRERWNHLNAVPLRRIYEHYIDPVSDHAASSLLALGRVAERKAPAMSPAIPSVEIATRTMSIEQQHTIAAPAARVFRALTEEIDAWWSPRLYDAPSTVKLEPHVGGRFYEEHDGQTALWAILRRFEPGKKLMLDGPLGFETPVASISTFELEEHAGKTTVRVSHRAIGEITDEQIAGYAEGWKVLMQTRLPDWVERGERFSRPE
jgi:DNA-binding transcriptional ArsR family regulator/uncharacterized protein YndB with AHSA1/START domain